VKERPRRIASGQSAVVIILVSGQPLPMETFKQSRQLGRLILRRDGETIAAGIVEEIIE